MTNDADDLLNPVVKIAADLILLNVGKASNNDSDLYCFRKIGIWLGIGETMINSAELAFAPRDFFFRLGFEEHFRIDI